MQETVSFKDTVSPLENKKPRDEILSKDFVPLFNLYLSHIISK